MGARGARNSGDTRAPARAPPPLPPLACRRLRLLATRRFDLHGKTIVLEQQHQKAAMASEWDAGGSLTGAAGGDAALVLAHYLPQLGSWRGRRVLELGAGAGLLANVLGGKPW